MNKGITAEQVAKVMDLDADGIFVSERAEHPTLGHTYEVGLRQDVDFSMYEVVALAALFGAAGITARYTADLRPGNNGTLHISVTES